MLLYTNLRRLHASSEFCLVAVLTKKRQYFTLQCLRIRPSCVAFKSDTMVTMPSVSNSLSLRSRPSLTFLPHYHSSICLCGHWRRSVAMHSLKLSCLNLRYFNITFTPQLQLQHWIAKNQRIFTLEHELDSVVCTRSAGDSTISIPSSTLNKLSTKTVKMSKTSDLIQFTYRTPLLAGDFWQRWIRISFRFPPNFNTARPAAIVTQTTVSFG